MQTGKILHSLDNIESAIRNHKLNDIETTNKIIREEIKNIQLSAKDNTVMELIFKAYFDWKVYSGQVSNEGFISGRQIDLESIFFSVIAAAYGRT